MWPGAVLRGDFGTIAVGARSSIQDGTVIHAGPGFPTVVGEGCVIGHLAHLEGCLLEDETLVGSGSVVLHHAVIRTGATVGANAVVPNRMEVASGAVGGRGAGEDPARGVAGVPDQVLGRRVRGERPSVPGVAPPGRVTVLHRSRRTMGQTRGMHGILMVDGTASDAHGGGCASVLVRHAVLLAGSRRCRRGDP